MVTRSGVFAGLVGAVLLSGCSGNVISAEAGRVSIDYRDAFSVFDRPPAPGDQIPERTMVDPDPPNVMQAQLETRRIARTPDLLIWIGHAPPDWICLVINTDPRHSTYGGSTCNKGFNAADGFQGLRWGPGTPGPHNPADDHTALLIPDGETATLNQGALTLIGDGVLDAQGETISIILTDPTGATRTFISEPPPR